MDKINAFKFVSKVLKTLKGEEKYNLSDFNYWFENTDTIRAGFLEKEVLINYIKQKY
jgi:hypothetical protein